LQQSRYAAFPSVVSEFSVANRPVTLGFVDRQAGSPSHIRSPPKLLRADERVKGQAARSQTV